MVGNHTRDVWDPKYDVAYHVAFVMGWKLELADESGKTQMANFKDVKITYPVDELIK